jgi:hypothetical protein
MEIRYFPIWDGSKLSMRFCYDTGKLNEGDRHGPAKAIAIPANRG